MTSAAELPRSYSPLLFRGDWPALASTKLPDVQALAARRALRIGTPETQTRDIDPNPSADFIEIFERAEDPTNVREVTSLFLSRVENRVAPRFQRRNRLELWARSRVRRSLTPEEVMSSRATVGVVKELFNSYFRDDLYGSLRSSSTTILSSGAVDEELFGLPEPLRECLTYAAHRNWYGYSDSRGREPSREAIARYESARMLGTRYDTSNICIGAGGTALMAGIADMVLSAATTQAPAVCGIPNYPPLVQSISRRHLTVLAAISEHDGQASLSEVVQAVTRNTPLVLIQTAINPTGARVSDEEIAALLRAIGPHTTVVLDECHEWLGDSSRFSSTRADPRIVRVNSMSKSWSVPGLKIGWLVASASFIEDFYEYSSTTFGGPASIFYTLIELACRMERWLLEGRTEVGGTELSELEPSYGLTEEILQRAYSRYILERTSRFVELRALRDASCQLLYEEGASLLDPSLSINAAVDVGSGSDGYVFFRTLLAQHSVSVFPGILTFVLSQDLVRFTSARSWKDLADGLPPLAHLASQYREMSAHQESKGKNNG